jgi:hypothetical protein
MENGTVDDQLFEVAVGPQKTATTPSSVTAKTFRHYDPPQSFLLPRVSTTGCPKITRRGSSPRPSRTSWSCR